MLRTIATSGIAGCYCDFLRRGRPRHRRRAIAWHVWTGPGAHNASAAGVATLEHLNGVSDEDLALAKRNGVIAVLTPFPEDLLQLSRTAEAARQEYPDEIDRLKSAHRQGVPIAFGTDTIFEAAGSSRGETTMRWIDSYVAAGIPPKDLLRAGMAADIIATPGNPLEDVQTLKHVAFVMKNSRVVRRP